MLSKIVKGNYVAHIIPKFENNRTHILKSLAILVKFGLFSKPVGTSRLRMQAQIGSNKKTLKGPYLMIEKR